LCDECSVEKSFLPPEAIYILPEPLWGSLIAGDKSATAYFSWVNWQGVLKSEAETITKGFRGNSGFCEFKLIVKGNSFIFDDLTIISLALLSVITFRNAGLDPWQY
jgi:hypothetical protein